MKKSFTITGSDEKPMAADLYFNDSQSNEPLIIYAHGFKGFKDWGNFELLAGPMVDAGFAVLAFNFSHNGTTIEQQADFADLEAFSMNNYTKELNDLKQVLKWVLNPENPLKNKFDVEKIGLIGHSMGGGLSIIFAAENRSVSALCTWAAISVCKTPWQHLDEKEMLAWKSEGVYTVDNQRTHQKMPLRYQLYEDYMKNEDRLDIKKAASGLTIPFLICHGTEDSSVPMTSAEAIQKACPNSTLFLLAGDHVFGRQHPATSDILPEAMQKVLGKTVQFFKEKMMN